LAAVAGLGPFAGQAGAEYKVAREELVHQAVWFILRGMGLTRKAIADYYNPRCLICILIRSEVFQ